MSYRTIKGLKNNEEFFSVIKKLYDRLNGSSDEFSKDEEIFLLISALLLLKAYDSDKSYKSYAEFGYNILLQYGIITKDFQPLYDIAINSGFYPIADLLVETGSIELHSLQDELSKAFIDETYSYEDRTETYEQKKMRDTLIESSDVNELSLIAPTSYGKSSLVIDDILATRNDLKKVVIVVPTKSLIAQTYATVKKAFKGQKIILHDEMYMNDQDFIAILTQERAIRLLIKNPFLSFDKMYIDEAHNLFSSDHRVIMLARLIKLNRERSADSKVTYLSPLISNSDNLRYSLEQDIIEQKIDFNMKEPMYYNYGVGNTLQVYNRFLDVFYDLPTKAESYMEYILLNSSDKNFIYLYSPRAIEFMCRELLRSLPNVQDPRIEEVITNLADHIHEDFFVIQCLRKGVLYLHGRLPDNVKEYLEKKFSEIDSIKYLIANRVVLEGVNLPIRTLFIFNTYRLHNKDLTNLIGRVNRLNDIFTKSKDIELLIPKIHFVNTETYNRSDGNMQRSIRTLRTGLSDDDVENPLLTEFDITRYHTERDKTKLLNAQRILSEEVVITNEPSDDIQKVKKAMIQIGLNNIFTLSDLFCETINYRITSYVPEEDSDIIDMIYQIFIKDLEEHIRDREFLRLKIDLTQEYYRRFINEYRSLPFKRSINRVVRSFISRRNNPEKSNLIFLGAELGEIPHPESRGYETNYVDLTTKTNAQLVNLSIAKLKLEGDFLHYKLAMVIQLLSDYEKITSDEYNFVVHGTSDIEKLKLMRLGMSSGLIGKIETDEQLQNITVNDNNQIVASSDFMEYILTLDDFSRFEIEKII
jgi:hypothetical protein